uniref:MAD2L1 binding protein n=2 Tax=Cyanistes caeruleus TaxID=156563 RepID=A0A8C0ZA37_CYACU
MFPNTALPARSPPPPPPRGRTPEPPRLPAAGRRTVESLPAALRGQPCKKQPQLPARHRPGGPGPGSGDGAEGRGYTETPPPRTPTNHSVSSTAGGRAAWPVRYSREAPRQRHLNPRRPLGERISGSFSEVLAALDLGSGRMKPQEDRSVLGSPAVAVAFSGAVCRGSGYRFACELLKHVLHQRNQLPLPYEQLSYFCRRAAQDGDGTDKPLSLGLASRKCQQLLMELEGLFQHLEIIFSLTLVPRVLFLLGGNVMNPKELYELNLEGFCEGAAEESLQTAPCVRQLFHRLFVADVFSELKALPITGTLVLVQGHRDCGVEWFRPKLNYRVPTRGRKLTVKVSCDGDLRVSASPPQHTASAWEDYIWFQAPVTLKGFSE